jgi:hypothetical protein
MADMKPGTGGPKPQLSQIPKASQVYTARGLEYGTDKYIRANHYGAAAPAPANVPAPASVVRVLGYIDAAKRHLTEVSDAIQRAMGTGGDVEAAVCTRDMDATGGFPASGLPDFCGAAASVALAISCAVNDGLLPADPGRPWAPDSRTPGLPQKDARAEFKGEF